MRHPKSRPLPLPSKLACGLIALVCHDPNGGAEPGTGDVAQVALELTLSGDNSIRILVHNAPAGGEWVLSATDHLPPDGDSAWRVVARGTPGQQSFDLEIDRARPSFFRAAILPPAPETRAPEISAGAPPWISIEWPTALDPL